MTDPVLNQKHLRVLVLMPNWLGDAIMATGLLTLLDNRRHLADGRRLHLTVGIREAWAPLFQGDPRCDDILMVERTGRHGGATGVFHLGRELARGNFQAALLGPPSLRVALASALARIPLRIGQATDRRGLFLSTSLEVLPRGRKHYFSEMLGLGESLIQSLGQGLVRNDFPTTTSLLGCGSIQAIAPGDCPRWILAPGATYGLAKTWPLPQALEFCRLAIAEEGVEIVLLGDAGAGQFAQDLAAGLEVDAAPKAVGQPGLVNLTGHTTLPEAAALLKGAAVFVGNDSGLMHLAAALGTPTIGIFGSSNPAWTAPVGPTTRALAARGFPCQPCYRRTCNQPEFCLDTITGRQVLTEVHDLLASGKGAIS
jgi:heptosyltransferase-2